jgi:hypothetical protein
MRVLDISEAPIGPDDILRKDLVLVHVDIVKILFGEDLAPLFKEPLCQLNR